MLSSRCRKTQARSLRLVRCVRPLFRFDLRSDFVRAALLIALALAGCAAPPPPASTVEASQKYVGERRWVSSLPINLCSSPDTARVYCERRIKSGGFVVQQSVRSNFSDVHFVKFDDGKEGWVSDIDVALSDGKEAHDQQVAEKKECDRRGSVSVGMTREQVYASCWGKPTKSTITAGGRHEQLLYPGAQYVYLRDGVVTSIRTSITASASRSSRRRR